MRAIFFPSPNGVCLSCNEKEVISVTDAMGQKKLKSFKTRNKVIFWHFPFIRGLQFLFCGLFMFFSSLISSFDLSGKVVKVKNLKKYYIQKIVILTLVVLLGIGLSELLMGFAANRLAYLIVDYRGNTLLRNLIMLIFKIGRAHV